MIRSRVLVAAGVLCALLLLPVSAALAADDLRLGDDVAPTFQRVHLHLDPAETGYSGSVHVDLEVYAPTRAVRFHAEEMELTAVSLRDAGGAEIPTTRADLDGARVEVTTEQPLAGRHAQRGAGLRQGAGGARHDRDLARRGDLPPRRGALRELRDPEIQARALEYLEEGPIRPTELFHIPGGIGDAPGGQERMFDWLVEHYEVIAGRMPPAFRAFMPNVASGCSAELLQRAEEFFSRPENSVQGTDVQLAKVAAQVNDCVNLRRREGERVARYLASLDGNGGA